jgi:putative phosphoserine phosphatase/1-acylglycerol-3-phosphate O-acyltransferase
MQKDGNEMTKKERIAAFFDFDQTLIEAESGKVGFHWLKDRGMLPFGFALKVMVANVLYRRHLVSEESMVKILLTFYRGKNLADFQKGADVFYRDYLKPHLAPRILARVNFHKQENHFLVLISGSVRYLLQPVVKDLGFHRLLCTDLEAGPDGLLTGRPKGPVCVAEHKKRLILDLAQEVGINMRASYAYGNHQADIPLLEAVGNPWVVEPTRPLAGVARRRGWPVLSFR